MDNSLHPTQRIRSREPSSPYLLDSDLRRAHGPPLLEAFPAKYRPSLRWPKGNRGFLPALRAIRLRLCANRTGVRASATLGPFRLARFTSFGLVLKSLVREEHLLAGGKHELRPALGALQHLIVIFHEALSP
jgi:hypothetical protein